MHHTFSKLATAFIALLILLYFSNRAPRTRYLDLTRVEDSLLKENANNSLSELQRSYDDYSKNSAYNFPRQPCKSVKLFNNNMFFKYLNARELKEQYVDSILSFFNSPQNFDWAETTWGSSDADYIIHFIDSDNYVIGKIWLCLADCNMVNSTPFCPNMKFGHLDNKASKKIRRLLTDTSLWQ